MDSCWPTLHPSSGQRDGKSLDCPRDQRKQLSLDQSYADLLANSPRAQARAHWPLVWAHCRSYVDFAAPVHRPPKAAAWPTKRRVGLRWLWAICDTTEPTSMRRLISSLTSSKKRSLRFGPASGRWLPPTAVSVARPSASSATNKMRRILHLKIEFLRFFFTLFIKRHLVFVCFFILHDFLGWRARWLP